MRNLLLSMAALLFSVAAIAQLYVKPNGTDASYVYVKDQVLFVENNIVLIENADSATEKASIYFRDGAQLIQGASPQRNIGPGYISIYQNSPDSDAWDYTYWSSPVGDQTIPQTGNVNFGAMRFFDVVGLTESTVNLPTWGLDGVQSPMQISRRWLYTYSASLGWNRMNDNSVVAPGRGFTMKGLGNTNHDQTYDFRGRPNNGDIFTAINANAYNLSGNPYPSALDLNKVFFDNPTIDSFKYWDEKRDVDSHYYVDNKGGYGSWTPGGTVYDPTGTAPGLYVVAPYNDYDNNGVGIGSNVGNGAMYQRRFAPVGQGFMLFGKVVGGTGTVTYNNSQRIYVKEGAANFSEFRSNDGEPVVVDESDSAVSVITGINETDYRLPQLRFNTYFNETHNRQLLLAFSDEATDGYDRGLDGLSSMDATSDAFFPIGGDEKKPYVIQGVKYEITKQIPYTLKLDVHTRVVIDLIEEVKFNGSAYIYDNVEDTYHEITNGLNAELVLPAGTYEDRFFITFVDRHRTQQVANEEVKAQVLEDVDFFQNNPAQQLEVANPEGYDIASANIFSMSGQLVYKAANVGDNSRLTFPTGNLSDGIYLVMLTTTDNVSINYKITVKNN